MDEPSEKRVSLFIDGQNLFHAVKEAFNYRYPNYDVRKLANSICKREKWGVPASIHFYTGVPGEAMSKRWHDFWRRKLDAMREEGIYVFSRTLRPSYSERANISGQMLKQPPIGVEKGIDVRLSLDVIRAAYENGCDIAVILSQDQDFSEVAKEVRYISKKQDRWIKIASAFPVSHEYDKKRGIEGTDWIRIDRRMYDECIDSKDYRTATEGKT